MKNIRYVFFAAVLAMVTGCATTAATTDSRTVNTEAGSDGVIRQKAEFKDLPVEMQESILQGGGGD